MEKKPVPPDLRKQLRLALFKSLVIPLLCLVFYAVAPGVVE
jgi:hypothetical protein